MAAGDVFMDSAGFLALWDAGDEHHPAATRLQEELIGHRRRFVTSEYVVDETVTLLLVRHSHDAATDFLDTIERSDEKSVRSTPDVASRLGIGARSRSTSRSRRSTRAGCPSAAAAQPRATSNR